MDQAPTDLVLIIEIFVGIRDDLLPREELQKFHRIIFRRLVICPRLPARLECGFS